MRISRSFLFAGRARLIRSLAPTAILAALWLPGINQGAYRVDTGLYAALGLHAWRSGPLWPLMSGDEPYFNKAPITIWIHGLFLHLFGTDLWVARLPSLIAAVACVWLTQRAAAEVSGRRVGFIAGCVLALTLEFFRYTRAISPDLWMVTFVMAASWGVSRAIRTGQTAPVVLAGIPLGLSLLTKPFVALLCIPAFAAWMAVASAPRRLYAGLAASAAVSIGIASLWYGPMWLRFGDSFIQQHIVRQAVDRVSGEGFESHPWWYYTSLMGTTYWPWLLSAAGGAWCWARSRRDAALPKRWDAAAMPIIWAAFWLVVLSLGSGKSGRYLVIVYPMLAWLSAMWLVHDVPRWVALARRGFVRWGPPILLAGSAVAAILGVRVHGPDSPHWSHLYQFVRDHSDEAIWAGPDMMWTSANVYLFTGRWPSTATDRRPPPAGSIRIYRVPASHPPGAGDQEIWRSGPMVAVRIASSP